MRIPYLTLQKLLEDQKLPEDHAFLDVLQHVAPMLPVLLS
jgi:hypothetical protein